VYTPYSFAYLRYPSPDITSDFVTHGCFTHVVTTIKTSACFKGLHEWKQEYYQQYNHYTPMANIDMMFFLSHALYNLSIDSIGDRSLWKYDIFPLNNMIKLIKVVWSWKVMIAVSISCLKGFNTEWCYHFDLCIQYAAFFHHCDQAYHVVWFQSLRSDLYTAYKVFLLNNATMLTFDLWLWKTIGFFLSWWW
jgi:hypothetical protein